MHSKGMPLIRIQVEHMKHAIIEHMGLVGSELGERIGEEVDKAIIAYKWEERIHGIVHNTLNTEIAHYFNYGKGNKIIKEAIAKGFEIL